MLEHLQCPKCGASLNPEGRADLFCSYCGARLRVRTGASGNPTVVLDIQDDTSLLVKQALISYLQSQIQEMETERAQLAPDLENTRKLLRKTPGWMLYSCLMLCLGLYTITGIKTSIRNAAIGVFAVGFCFLIIFVELAEKKQLAARAAGLQQRIAALDGKIGEARQKIQDLEAEIDQIVHGKVRPRPEIGRDGTREPQGETKDVSGQRLSRRDWLKATVAAAAATVAAAAAVIGMVGGYSKEQLCKAFRAHQGNVFALAVSPDGKLLASGSGDKTIKLWSLPGGALLRTLKGHQDSVNALAVSPDGKLLASGSWNGTIKLWSLPEGELLKNLEGSTGSISTLAMSPDGKLLVSGSDDNTIKLWLLPEGKLLKTLEGHEDWVLALAMSPDGKLLASGSWTGTIKLWSLPEGELLKNLEGSTGSISTLAMSPDGKLLASGGWHNEAIQIWSLPDGALLKTLEGCLKKQEKCVVQWGVYALAVSPDGKLLASGSSDEAIKLWSLPEGMLLKTLEGLQETEDLETDCSWGVYALAVSPDGKLLASGSSDEAIKLCSLPEGEFVTYLIDMRIIPR